jgi:hypothetical protein
MRDHVLQDTVSIGEAVQQLGVTAATPEEIWAQVRAQREHRARGREIRSPRRSGRGRRRSVLSSGRRSLAAAAVAAALTGAGWWGLAGRREMPIARELPAPETAPAPAPAAAGTLRTLAEIPDGQFVECAHEVLERLLKGGRRADASKLIVRDLRAARADGSWLLVKHGGTVYVHGYMAPMSPGAMAALGTIRIYSGRLDDRRAGGLAYLEPITLRVRGGFSVHGSGSEGGLSSISVSDLRPDEHAKEKPEY